MVVALTSNIGLKKPDDTELAKNWANFDKIQEFNNLLIRDKMDVNITSYTPVLKGSSADPNLGTTGGTSGEYYDFQGMIFGSYIIKFDGTGISTGSGDYAVSLPVRADGAFHFETTSLSGAVGQATIIGEGYNYDASNLNSCGGNALELLTVAGVSYVRMIVEAYTVPTKTARVINSDHIFVPVAGDRFTGNFIYKKL